jgi:acyl dehydratase
MAEQPETYITDEVRSLIGRESEPSSAWDLVEPGAVRRFTQAIMDPDPIYWNDEAAKARGFGGPVAPPLYPGFTFRRAAGTPDPLDRAKENPNFDGIGGGGGGRLPTIPNLPVRTLNGGVEAEFFALARHGDRITAQSRYADIYEREGRTGKMVFVVTETTYTNQDGTVLAKIRNTGIRR